MRHKIITNFRKITLLMTLCKFTICSILASAYSNIRIIEKEQQKMLPPQSDELRLLHNNICRALGDPLRIQILYALNVEPLNVTALSTALEVPQSTASRHLSILRQRSLVTTERTGQAVTYRLADQRIIRVLESMRMILRDSLERQSSILV